MRIILDTDKKQLQSRGTIKQNLTVSMKSLCKSAMTKKRKRPLRAILMKYGKIA